MANPGVGTGAPGWGPHGADGADGPEGSGPDCGGTNPLAMVSAAPAPAPESEPEPAKDPGTASDAPEGQPPGACHCPSGDNHGS